MRNGDSVEDWLEACVREAPAFLRALGSERLERRARAWLGVQVARMHDAAWARQFFEACPVEGAAPDKYLQRVLDLGAAGRALTGIRFRGTNMRFPFVDVLVTDAPIERCLTELVAAVREAYARFGPVALRIFVPRDPAGVALPKGAYLDQVFCAADLSEVAARAAARDDVRLVALTEGELAACHEAVQSAYEEFREDDPELAELVPPADLGHLRSCFETGYLGRVEDAESGAWVGVFGIHTDEEWLFDEFCVCEEVLRRSHRGRGIAAWVQGEAARQALAQGRAGLLWGTINARNVASRRTAARAGRPERAAWAFVPLP